MISTRRDHHAFGRGDFEWIDLENIHIAAFKRSYQRESILAIHNLSNAVQTISYQTKESAETRADLLSKKEFASSNGKIEIELAPYQFLWLR
jgi:maltose alpha-D-glucosyltransferase/alpha-amylase